MAARLGLTAVIVATILAPSFGVDFDFFYLTRQWAGGVCNHHNEINIEENHSHRACIRYPADDIFTIHGLWPNREDGSWPQFCDDSAVFDMEGLKGLHDDLSKEWPSYYGTNYGFWRHEWIKHGTCAAPFIANEREYFEKTLDLKEKYDLMDALARSGITPTMHRVYSRWGVEKAIKQMTGARPIIKCSGHNPATLTEIWMCFSLDFKPIDCTAGTSSRCSDLVFPPMIRTSS